MVKETNPNSKAAFLSK